MKDQYFGDARDYLKYHLLEELIGHVPSLRQLVCLWMLTAPDRCNVPFEQNPALPELSRFLQDRIDHGERRVSYLRQYFGARGIAYTPWGDEPPYFANNSRDGYFASVPGEFLEGALIFLDPDVGLTWKDPTPKHLTYAELIGLRSRIDRDSITVVYQHFQRRPGFWDTMASDLRAGTKSYVGYVAEPAVGFFVMTNRLDQVETVDESLERVAAVGRARRVGRSRQ